MRLTDTDADSTISVSPDGTGTPEAGPSTLALTNGHNGIAKSNGVYTNGNSGRLAAAQVDGHGLDRQQRPPISRVTLPGTTLYDDSDVDREEFVRLVIQSLRDVGYM